jgi:hypothetical protein
VSPIAALAINDAARRGDVAADEDLWTAADVAAAPPLAYDYLVPTLTPCTWPTPRRLGQEGYTAEFTRRTPIAAKLLLRVNGEEAKDAKLWAAGGAAAAPYYEAGVNADDVDFFVVGIDPSDADALWAKAHEVVRALHEIILEEETKNFFEDHRVGDLVQKMDPGLLTLTLQLRCKNHLRGSCGSAGRARKYQVILRAYPTVSAMIHAFDVPSCCVAFDGKTAVTTTLGAYAQRFRVNLVNPAYRSTTYEKRLVKYFGRHYALGLVHLKTGEMVAGAPLELPHLTLRPVVVRGNRATGKAEAPAPEHASDYELDSNSPFNRSVCWDGAGIATYSAAFVNLSRLSAGIPGVSMVRCTEGLMSRHRRNRHHVVAPRDYEWLPFARWYGPGAAKHPPTYAEVFPRAAFDRSVKTTIATIYDKRMRVQVSGLMRYLGMSCDEVARFTEGLLMAIAQNPRRRIVVGPALEPFKARLAALYEAAAARPIAWWVTEDAGRQYTASLNPRVEDPADWYGAGRVAAAPGEVSREVYVESLLAALESRQIDPGADEAPVYEGSCALCLTPLLPGAANSITLPCGHVFHWSRYPASGCEGLYRWTLHGHSDCPTCRNDFGAAAGAAAAAAANADANADALRAPDLALEIDWLAPRRGAPPDGDSASDSDDDFVNDVPELVSDRGDDFVDDSDDMPELVSTVGWFTARVDRSVLRGYASENRAPAAIFIDAVIDADSDGGAASGSDDSVNDMPELVSE